jgi:hypothetical protein
MNIFSNAIGITEDEYYADQYDRQNEYQDSYSSNNGYGLQQDRSSYENNYYDREYYPSYKQDYNDEYNSYENNKEHKSKDKERSNSVSISKINCNTVNYNFNNVAIGNFTNGNSGIGEAAAAADGTNQGALNANANVNGNNQGYSNGYQKGKDITCIINNNNTNISTGAASNATNGNATNGNGNATDACVECFFEILTEDQIAEIETLFEAGGIFIELDILGTVGVTINSFEEFCEFVGIVLDLGLGVDSVFFYVDQLVGFVVDDDEDIDELTDCIEEALGIETDSNGIVAPFDINTKPSDFQSNTKGSLTSFGIHNEATEEDLTAMEKITKLKQQWMELTP